MQWMAWHAHCTNIIVDQPPGIRVQRDEVRILELCMLTEPTLHETSSHLPPATNVIIDNGMRCEVHSLHIHAWRLVKEALLFIVFEPLIARPSLFSLSSSLQVGR